VVILTVSNVAEEFLKKSKTKLNFCLKTGATKRGREPDVEEQAIFQVS
jgi:hypothetical protein